MISIVIPTYNRGSILVETIERLLALPSRAESIIVVDQTPRHPAATVERLTAWNADGSIDWRRLDAPSIPGAMNEGLRAATTALVLFLDDDIRPAPNLIGAHAAAHDDPAVWAVTGQVLQPGQSPASVARPPDDLEFPFHRDEACFVTNVMAGNLSVKRQHAIDVGGFDENYVGAAYRFETDFALRIVAAGGIIRFDPTASIDHLKLSSGGIRSFGDHKTTISPAHTVGDYYFAMRNGLPLVRYTADRVLKNVVTRYHFLHPWNIPGKLIGELRGFLLALRLRRRGPRLIEGK